MRLLVRCVCGCNEKVEERVAGKVQVAVRHVAHHAVVDNTHGLKKKKKDIIYISLVRSNEKMEIGFLNDIRRMNVALTRAKKKLVVIGDSATLGNHPFYKEFLDYTEHIMAYKSAWEYAGG